MKPANTQHEKPLAVHGPCIDYQFKPALLCLPCSCLIPTNEPSVHSSSVPSIESELMLRQGSIVTSGFGNSKGRNFIVITKHLCTYRPTAHPADGGMIPLRVSL